MNGNVKEKNYSISVILDFCNALNCWILQENGTPVETNSTPEPEDKNLLKVIKQFQK